MIGYTKQKDICFVSGNFPLDILVSLYEKI